MEMAMFPDLLQLAAKTGASDFCDLCHSTCPGCVGHTCGGGCPDDWAGDTAAECASTYTSEDKFKFIDANMNAVEGGSKQGGCNAYCMVGGYCATTCGASSTEAKESAAAQAALP